MAHCKYSTFYTQHVELVLTEHLEVKDVMLLKYIRTQWVFCLYINSNMNSQQYRLIAHVSIFSS